MATMEPCQEPLIVGVVDDEVVVTGARATGVALTPDAATETAARLQAAAAHARENASYASQTCANEA